MSEDGLDLLPKQGISDLLAVVRVYPLIHIKLSTSTQKKLDSWYIMANKYTIAPVDLVHFSDLSKIYPVSPCTRETVIYWRICSSIHVKLSLLVHENLLFSNNASEKRS